ncbi:pilus assembly protein [Pseudonocardia petroleophila]
MIRVMSLEAERGGSPSVEAAILAVVIGVLIAFVIAGGRLVTVEAVTDHAARSASRVASLHRDAASAQSAAESTARQILDGQDIRCTALTVRIDTSGFATPLGQPASVTATVRCDVDWSDLGLPGASGGRSVEASFTSPIDRWRERA